MESRTKPTIVCRVTRPELTPEERERRMAEIKKAAAALIVAQMKARST